MSEEKPVVKITEEEKLEFFKSFLADKPYTKHEKLFDGKFTVKFRALSVQEANDVFEQLRRDQLADEASSDASNLMSLTHYRLSVGILELNEAPFQPEITKETYKPIDSSDSYIKARSNIFKGWSVFKLSILADAFRNFENKMIDLTKEINTENFWPAVQ